MASIAYRAPVAAPLATLIALLAGCVALALIGRDAADRAPAADSMRAEIAELPLAFEPRRDGEFAAPSVAGGNLAVSSGHAALSLPEPSGSASTLSLELVGANPDPDVTASEPLPGRVNRFIGDDPARWRTGVPTYGRVSFAEVYPGIGIDYYGNQRDLEYDFRLAPGADPNRIAIELGGADAVSMDRTGGLAIDVGTHRVHQLAPVAYQPIGAERVEVPVRFALDGRTVGFALGDYDRSRPLVIDPVIVSFSTIAGGDSSADPLEDIAVDASGDVYVAGEANTAVYEPLSDSFQSFGGAFGDAIVIKLDVAPDGAVSVAYSTFLGGGATDTAFGVAADAAGAAYVTGTTQSTNFPTQDPLPTVGGDQPQGDAFVTKLDPDTGGAVTLAYSTYLGGNSSDGGHSVAVDAGGAAYVGIDTGSTDFPTQDPLPLIGGNQPGFDAAITKLAPDSGGAVTLAYSTYIGSNAADGVNGIAVTPDGTVFATGVAFGNDFPIMSHFQTDQGGIDGFVVKLAPADFADLDYSTYLGGSADDFPEAIAVNSAGSAYVFGDTESTDFPTLRAFQLDQGGTDTFVTKLDPGGTAVLGYSTYLGGSGFDGTPDESEGIAVDDAGGVYVAGLTASTDFPLADPFDSTIGGTTDAFATRLAPDGGGPVELSMSTYYGGTSGEQATSVAASGNAFWLVGDTNSDDLPQVDPVTGITDVRNDAYISRFEPAPPAPAADMTPPETTIVKGPRKQVKKRKASFAFESSEAGSTFECAVDKKPFAACSTPAKFKVKRKPRTHKLRVRAIDAAGNVDPTPAKRKWKLKRTRR